jgi:F0F1-type ATP synthase assembly protein I
MVSAAVPGMDRDVDPDNGEHSSGGPAPKPPNWGLAMDLGLRLGISVVLGLGIGLIVDNRLQTSPIFTLVGIVLGIAAAKYTIWDVARDNMRK